METNNKTFKCKDEILLKYKLDESVWFHAIFSSYSNANTHIIISGGFKYSLDSYDILPYKGNKHLVGTTDEHYEEIKLEKGEYMWFSDNTSLSYMEKWLPKRFEEIDIDNYFISYDAYRETKYQWSYAIRFSDFNPNDMVETKKHVLCVKNGKVVKYRE